MGLVAVAVAFTAVGAEGVATVLALPSPPAMLPGGGAGVIGEAVVLVGAGMEVVGGGWVLWTGGGVARGGGRVRLGSAGLAGVLVGDVSSAAVLVSCPGVAILPWGLRQGRDARCVIEAQESTGHGKRECRCSATCIVLLDRSKFRQSTARL